MSRGNKKPPVVLGRRHRRVPADVPARTNKKAFKTAIALLRGDAAPVVARITERVNHVVGRNRQLQVDVLLAAAIASAREGVMEPRRASALLRGLGSSTQIEYGIRVVDVRGAIVVSEAQVRYLFDQIAKAFVPDGASHDHPVVDGEHVVNPVTGEIVGPADTLTVEQLVDCECTSACPAALSAEHLGNELIGATWTHFGIPDTSTWAVDSYLLISHYSPRSWGDAATMEFPDEPAATTRTPAPGKSKAKTGKPRGGRKPSAGTKTAAVNAHDDWANTQREASPNSSRKRPPAGPTASGDFTRLDREFPQIGADGRLVHTVDPDARNGFRGAGRSRRTEIANGRDKHALVASGMFADGTPFPAFIRSYCLTPWRWGQNGSVFSGGGPCPGRWCGCGGVVVGSWLHERTSREPARSHDRTRGAASDGPQATSAPHPPPHTGRVRDRWEFLYGCDTGRVTGTSRACEEHINESPP